jgi:general secretion pathway protein J
MRHADTLRNSRKSASKLCRQRGFTLLELLISSIIFAIMALMAYGGLSNVIDNSEASGEALDRLREVQQSISILDRDFSQIVERPVRDEYGVTQPYLLTNVNSDELVELTRGGRVNPAKMLRSSLLRVAYLFEENELIRLQWQHLDRAQGIEPKQTTILKDIEDITIKFLDSNGETSERWPPLNATGNTTGDNTNTPSTPGATPQTLRLQAIEVIIDLSDWGEIRRVYALN